MPLFGGAFLLPKTTYVVKSDTPNSLFTAWDREKNPPESRREARKQTQEERNSYG